MEWLTNLFQNEVIATVATALLALGGIGTFVFRKVVRFLPVFLKMATIGQGAIDFLEWYKEAYKDKSFTKAEIEAGSDIVNKMYHEVITFGTAVKNAGDLEVGS